MRPNAKAFLLLILVVTAAGALAVFIRGWQGRVALPPPRAEMLPPKVPDTTVEQTPATGTGPLAIMQAGEIEPSTLAAPTTTTAAKSSVTSVSSDGMTSVAVIAEIVGGTPSVTSPVLFHGTTTAPESQISWKLTDKKKTTVASGIAYVSGARAGTPRTFRVSAEFTALPKTATGTLMVYGESAKDGAPIHAATVPVLFQPAP